MTAAVMVVEGLGDCMSIQLSASIFVSADYLQINVLNVGILYCYNATLSSPSLSVSRLCPEPECTLCVELNLPGTGCRDAARAWIMSLRETCVVLDCRRQAERQQQ